MIIKYMAKYILLCIALILFSSPVLAAGNTVYYAADVSPQKIYAYNLGGTSVVYTAPTNFEIGGITIDSKGNYYATIFKQQLYTPGYLIKNGNQLLASQGGGAVTVDSNDNVYYVDQGNSHELYKLEKNGRKTLLYTAPYNHVITGIGVDGAGNYYAMLTDNFSNLSYLIKNGTIIYSFPSTMLCDGDLFVDVLGIVYFFCIKINPVTGASTEGIYKFISSGSFETIYTAPCANLPFCTVRYYIGGFAIDGILGLGGDFYVTLWDINQPPASSGYLVKNGINLFPISHGGSVFVPQTSPTPVLLVHGIYSDDSIWVPQVENILESEGFRVFKVGEVNGRTGFKCNNGPIQNAAGELHDAIRKIKQQTGAQQVDIVAHSVGGLAARWYIKNNFYQNDVRRLVMLGTPNEGAQIAKHPVLATIVGLHTQNYCIGDIGRKQMIPNSPFLKELNKNYFPLATHHDTVTGLMFTPDPWLAKIICLFEPSYCPPNEIVTDSIVPMASANFFGSCYEYGVTHTAQLGPTYYNQGIVIQEMISLLNNSRANFPTCSELDAGTTAPGNTVEIKEYQGLIAAGQEQTIANQLHISGLFSGALTGTSGTLALEFISPSGQVINATTSSSLTGVTYASKIVNSTTAIEWFTVATAEQGNWTVKVRAPTTLPTQENYVVTLFLRGDISLAVTTDNSLYKPGETMIINALLFNQTTPVLQATVSATVNVPGSQPVLLQLFDDGNHNDQNANDGIYGHNFSQTSNEGAYFIDVNASKQNEFELLDRTTAFVELFPDLEIKQSDLQVVPTPIPPNQNVTINITATIHNIGEKDAENATIEIYDGDPTNNPVLITNGTFTIPKGNAITMNTTLSHISNNPNYPPHGDLLANVSGASVTPRTVQGPSFTEKNVTAHNVFVVISSFSTFIEANYSNNVANKTIFIGPVRS